MPRFNLEILNLDKYMDFAFLMKDNMLLLWNLQGLGGKRRLQKLLFPHGFIYDKNCERIEPYQINQFFLLKPSFLASCEDKKRDKPHK